MRSRSPVRPGTRSEVERASSADLAMLALDRRETPEQVGGILLLRGGPAFDVGTAEAEALHVVAETIGAELEADLDRADVARLDDHVLERQDAVIVRVGDDT